MSKTNVLVVSSEYGLGVLEFNRYNKEHNLTLHDWVEKVSESGIQGKDVKYLQIEDEDYNFSVDLYEFNTIDSRFFDLVREVIQDDSERVNTDFFIVE